MPSMNLPTSFGPFSVLPRDASPRLRIIQNCQMGVAVLAVVAAFFTLVIPSERKFFTLSLLYTPLLTSITTVYLVRREQRRAVAGTLSKQRYIKYQCFKLAAAIGMSIIGFIGHIASTPAKGDAHFAGERGLWISGIKINTWQGLLLWLNFFNWVFLWASLFYSCCMTGRQQGSIALTGEEARIGINPEEADDEAIARALQAEDPNWQR
ncbi:uncharacterized protein J4E79_001702 [Alternaria viburni]|uniref:uncharacterized protein n=1 Tax=Alternaria viburni TaxID=566460 RepID=UPI0020C4F558|nr:uncharacterized protein J4E79_001702 [Alternaria viburni]KAI4667021.1 hypothetical protein J4E79_001702 [Alternaria viburni]